MEAHAQHTPESQGEEGGSRFFTFYLGEQAFGIDVSHVRELLVTQTITPLPDAPVKILGAVDVRGTPLPVVDLQAWLGVPATASSHEPQILIVDVAAGSNRRPLGILVSRVRDVDQIPDGAIQPCPSIGISDWDNSIIQGLSLRGPDLIILIRIDALFGEMIADLEMEEAGARF